jgi:hypothetical protein
MWHTAEREHRADAEAFVDALRGNGPLRAGLDRDSAIDIVWFFYRPRSLSTTRSRQAVESPRYEE